VVTVEILGELIFLPERLALKHFFE
jgi:hypothetical protein